MRWSVILFFLLLLLHFCLYWTVEDPHSIAWFGNLMQGMVLLLAAIQFTRAGIPEKKDARPRIFIILGLWVCLTAHALLTYSELLLRMPATATVTDLIWLLGYVLLAGSFYLMVQGLFTKREAIRWQLRSLALIGLIVLAVLWAPLTDPERTIPVKFVQFIFPFLDLWIAAMAFLLSQKTGIKAWLLIPFGSLVIGITDLIFPYFHTMSSPIYRYLDIPLFVGYSMWWLLGTSFAAQRN